MNEKSKNKKVVEVQLYRLHLNKDGYTTEGYYYGVGAPVFFFEYKNDKEEWGTMRANSMRDARKQIKNKLGNGVYVKFTK